jgi:beta-mannosidase
MEILLDGSWRFIAFPKKVGEQQGVYDPYYSTKGWLDAFVPGNVYSHLVNTGLIPNKPDSDSNDESLSWITDREWWYRTDFLLPVGFPRQNTTLIFQHLSSEVIIWLNGERIYRTTEAFSPIQIDVGTLINEGPNTLAVCFTSLSPQSGILGSVKIISRT